LDVAQLAQLLYLGEETVVLYASQYPDRLPPQIQGGRKKRWVASVVLNWLVRRQNRLCEVDFGGLIVSASRLNQSPPGVPMDSLAGMVQTTMRATCSGMGGVR
jgi:predicted DNA-binding transcriptional regulator AlpA